MSVNSTSIATALVRISEKHDGDRNPLFRQEPRPIVAFAGRYLAEFEPELLSSDATSELLNDPDALHSALEKAAEEGSPALRAQAHDLLCVDSAHADERDRI